MAFLFILLTREMTPNEAALVAQMEELYYSQGMITMALHILSNSKGKLRDALLYLLDKHPSEEDFISYISQAFTSR